MSHISKIELIINSLDDLKHACNQLGFTFVEGQKTYQWYGQWMEDTPLPEGVTKDQLGQCDHAIKVPECRYEIGVVKRNDHWILLWDSWHKGGLVKKIGLNAGILKQAYSISRITKQAKLKKYSVSKKKTKQGFRPIMNTCVGSFMQLYQSFWVEIVNESLGTVYLW